MTKSMQICPFCKHWVNDSIEKCNNCGEFIGLRSKRLWFNISPIWLSSLATIVIAVISVFGLYKVDTLLRERAKVIENHSTWVEVRPISFSSNGVRDPEDETSTFWHLNTTIKNLGEKPAFVEITNWKLNSSERGEFGKKSYANGTIKFTVEPNGNKIFKITFVMNPDYHISLLNEGSDILNISFIFNSSSMLGDEICNYNANLKYTKGKFSLINDTRSYVVKE